MNTITKSWCRFSGWAANCFEVMSDQLYFGGNGIVAKAWQNFSDAGVQISATAIPAFHYFGRSSQLKHWKLARPIMAASGSFGIVTALNTDFDLSAPGGTPTFSANVTATWDSSLWDSAIWGGDVSVVKDWTTVNGIGYAGSMSVKIATTAADVRWMATDYVYERGGVV